MKKLSILATCALFGYHAFVQDKSTPSLNLNFEEIENSLPKGWRISGSPNYKTSIDKQNVQNGKNALFIEGSGGYKIITLDLPHNYTGKKLPLPDM